MRRVSSPRPKHFACAIASMLLPLVACSGASPSAEDGGFDPSQIELGDLERDFCAPWTRILCERAERCGCGAVVPGGVLDVEGCVRRETADCVRTNAPAVAAGAVLDVRAVRACIAEIERQPECARLDIPASCGALLFLPIAIGDECTMPFPAPCAGNDGVCFPGSACVGRPREGEPCFDLLCARGLFCSDETRRCVALGDEGAPCRQGDECDPSLRCVGDLLSGTCRAPVGEGGACGATAECAVGLVCSGGACAAGDESRCSCGASRRCEPTAWSCQPRRAADERCSETRECAPDLACSESGVCVARPIEGESCGPSLEPCAPSLACRLEGVGGTCVPAPSDGEACGPVGDDWQPVCAGELVCSVAGYVCAAPQPEGGACELHEDCAAGLRCVDGTCSTGLREGESCSVSAPACAEGLFCDREVCRAAFDDGAHCDSFRPCVHQCLPDATGGGTCAPAPGLGDPCRRHAQCPDDLACLAGDRACIAEICAQL